jgi:hypothetical protein
MDCSFALSKDLGMEKLGTWNKKFMQLKKIFNLREILRGARWPDSSFAAQERISSPATCDTVVGLVMLQFSCIAKNFIISVTRRSWGFRQDCNVRM